MKKNVLLIVLVIGILITATACANSDNQESEPPVALSTSMHEASSGESNISTQESNITYDLDKMPEGPNIDAAPVADLTDLYALTEVYVWPLTVNGGTWFQSWATPQDIPADQLVYVCAFNGWVEYDNSDETVQPFAPAEEVEAALQKHFDVTADYLRTASAYNAENNTYPMTEGGGGWAAVAMSAKQQGTQIVIQVGALPPDETQAEKMGILTLELTDENVVRYISYESTQED